MRRGSENAHPPRDGSLIKTSKRMLLLTRNYTKIIANPVDDSNKL